jgi:hypothetical protein
MHKHTYMGTYIYKEVFFLPVREAAATLSAARAPNAGSLEG